MMADRIEAALSVFDGKEQCHACDGQGAYWDDQTGQPDEPQGGRMLPCSLCAGQGWVVREPCLVCGAPITMGADEPDEHDEGCPVVAWPEHNHEHYSSVCGNDCPNLIHERKQQEEVQR